jgi:hypothetical protein
MDAGIAQVFDSLVVMVRSFLVIRSEPGRSPSEENDTVLPGFPDDAHDAVQETW